MAQFGMGYNGLIQGVRITAIIIVFWLLGPRSDTESERVFSVLAEFIRNGQLVVETLPPLSFVFVFWRTQNVLLLALSFQCLAFCLLVFALLPRAYKKQAAWLPISVVIALYSWRLSAMNGSTIGTIGATSGLSDALLLLALVTLGFEANYPGQILSVFTGSVGISELLAITSYFFGCDAGQFVCFASVHFIRLFNDVQDTTQNSGIVASRAIRKVSVFLVLFCAVAQFAYSGFLPFSEVSFTGNYHLNMLPPAARRSLRDAEAEKSDQASGQTGKWNASSPYTVYAGIPYSLYIPAAGFLFADNLIWNPFAHAFVEEADYQVPDDPEEYEMLTQTGEIAAAHHRVFFEDKLGVEIPWQILQVGKNSTKYTVSRPKDHPPLRPESYVIIRHINSGEFLAVEPDVYSVVDRELMIEPESDGFMRLHVSLSKELTPSAVWILRYNPDSDTGLRLFNPDSKCYLSTSFRSFPDFHGLRSNDSVVDELAMELEAACINAPSERAQTLYLVDGLRTTDPNSPPTILSRLLNHLYRAFAMYQATRLLSEFRTLFPNLQDVPRSLLKEQFTQVQADYETLLNYSFVVLVLLWVLRLMYRQRMGLPLRGGNDHNIHSGAASVSWAEMGVGLALARLGGFALYGFGNGTSGRVAGVISVHSWMSLWDSLFAANSKV